MVRTTFQAMVLALSRHWTRRWRSSVEPTSRLQRQVEVDFGIFFYEAHQIKLPVLHADVTVLQCCSAGVEAWHAPDQCADVDPSF